MKKEGKYYSSSRDDIIALIPEDAGRVLDVGCGFGFMAKKLKEARHIEVVGIEKEGEAADVAKGNVDRLLTGDAEDMTLPFEKGYFDCITYGDVLGCLRDPWRLLKEHTRYLKKGGCCIASIANVAHYSIIKGLLRNKWEYVPAGLLDESCLRFFTLDGMKSMFRDAGYAFEEKKRYVRASKSKKILNRILRGKIEYLFTEQYLIKGVLS